MTDLAASLRTSGGRVSAILQLDEQYKHPAKNDANPETTEHT
jgi:hypothetical protein